MSSSLNLTFTPLLEVALGLFVMFAVVSTTASAGVELLETWLRRRARHLARGVAELLAAGKASSDLLPQAKRAARGFRTVENFIAIAYLRMSKLAHLPQSPLGPAKPRETGITGMLCEVKFHSKRHRAGQEAPRIRGLCQYRNRG